MLLIPCISSIHCCIIDAHKHVGLMKWRNPRSRQSAYFVLASSKNCSWHNSLLRNLLTLKETKESLH